ncbi:tRNA (guanosine(46)-N7)-methyltransferase TrmB, partial [Mesorhizobium sp. M8A.F.Ca.ET.021.01.1.1]
MRDGDRPSRTTEAFFGRRRGKPVRPQQAAALESGLGAYRLDLTAEAPSDPRT